jgi:hypothetical protein
MALGWHSEPGCIVHGVPGTPYPNVYKPYEKCADFFTFGHGSTFATSTSDVNSSYWILTIIGILVMVAAFVAWVMTEDRKLRQQAARLLISGQAGQVVIKDTGVPQPGLGCPADLGDV